MRERGLVPDKFSYKPLLAYVANRGMAEEFQYLVEQMKEDTVEFSEDLSYYEMILWIKAGNREKVLELCNAVDQEGAKHRCTLAGIKQDRLSDFVCNYALNVRNMEVHIALDLFEDMCKQGLAISADTFHPIMRASERSNELDLILPTYSVMRNHGVKPTGEIFKHVINSFIKMKNFEAAYNVLDEMKGLNMRPTVNLYNAIMAGYFREYYEEMQRLAIPASKYAYMGLINVFVSCGHLHKAKEIFCLISETAQPNLEDAFVLLEAMRKKMKVRPSRTGLDFLLSACVGMKDSYSAKLICQEYIKEELSFNVLTLLRIFQVLLASGEHEDATLVLKRITRNDLRDQHVRYIIKMYVKLYQVPPDNIPLLTEGINLD